jgi:hypothetical protein
MAVWGLGGCEGWDVRVWDVPWLAWLSMLGGILYNRSLFSSFIEKE